MPNLRPLAAQTMVIAGASSGIGLAAAKGAARRGARVFLISRNGPALQAICDDIASDGGVAAFAVADVGDAQALSAAADAAVAAFGPFDSWVHAAGVAIYAPLLETPADEHERLFRTNYWGVVNASRVAVPALRPRGGAFVVVGSVASDIGTPVLGAYAASKHAVKGFIDSLRIELLAERAPVSVTLVKPSGIGTPLAEHAANHQGAAAKVPPPAYSPEVAARAILHAVQHPRREIIVGGVGAFQRAGAILAPGLADRISSLVPPLLRDRRRPANVSNNLDHPRSDGRIRSPSEPSIPFSLYTGAVLHPGLALVAAGLVAGLIWALGGETGAPLANAGEGPDRFLSKRRIEQRNSEAMAGGWTRDGAVLDQIEDTVTDGVLTARARMPVGEGTRDCVECGEPIPDARRRALPSARTCIDCQSGRDSRVVLVGINRRGSKDSQLR